MKTITAKLTSIEEKLVRKDEGEVKTFKATFEGLSAKVVITQEKPFKDLVVGQEHEFEVTCTQSTLEE